MPKFTIRRMVEKEVSIAVEWAQQEGWNPGLDDAHSFYQADQNGFFIGLVDKEPIAVGSAIVYDDTFAFCGLYIVKPEFRSHGYGLQLTEERLKYTGKRVTGIDGVLANVSKYERIGYVPSHKQIRYQWSGNATFLKSPSIVDLQGFPINQVEAFDGKYFQAPRSHFLKNWINQPPGHALGFIQNQQLAGYGVIRQCHQGYKIGPLFADTPEIAHALFEALCAKVNAGPVYLDVPEPNQHALSLVAHYQMTPVFEVIRMYRNGFPEINLSEGVYGITTFELG
jgi:GNAT superfamily N-acetyltransferase